MTREEFTRLLEYDHAKRNRPTYLGLGKKHAKGRAAGYGQILKSSFVKPLVSIEKVWPKL